MRLFADIAIAVVEECKINNSTNPREAWKKIAIKTFPNRKAAQEKSCPMSAFLGLCEEGLVKHIPKKQYTRSLNNKAYAVQAAKMLRQNPNLTVSELWCLIDKDVENKTPNEQMSVVKGLFDNELLVNCA